jgi:hypothetical protein
MELGTTVFDVLFALFLLSFVWQRPRGGLRFLIFAWHDAKPTGQAVLATVLRDCCFVLGRAGARALLSVGVVVWDLAVSGLASEHHCFSPVWVLALSFRC